MRSCGCIQKTTSFRVYTPTATCGAVNILARFLIFVGVAQEAAGYTRYTAHYYERQQKHSKDGGHASRRY